MNKATIQRNELVMHLFNGTLKSFSGELGNMIAGSLSTNIVEQGITIDITYPTILQGNMNISAPKVIKNIKTDYLTGVAKLESELLLILNVESLFSLKEIDEVKEVKTQ